MVGGWVVVAKSFLRKNRNVGLRLGLGFDNSVHIVKLKQNFYIQIFN